MIAIARNSVVIPRMLILSVVEFAVKNHRKEPEEKYKFLLLNTYSFYKVKYFELQFYV